MHFKLLPSERIPTAASGVMIEGVPVIYGDRRDDRRLVVPR